MLAATRVSPPVLPPAPSRRPPLRRGWICFVLVLLFSCGVAGPGTCAPSSRPSPDSATARGSSPDASAADDPAGEAGPGTVIPRVGDVSLEAMIRSRKDADIRSRKGGLSPWNWDSRKVEGIRRGEVMLTFGDFDGAARGSRYWLYRKIGGKPRLIDLVEVTSTQTHACRAVSALDLVVPLPGDLVRDPVVIPDSHGHSMYYLETAEDYFLRGGYDLGFEQVVLALQRDRRNHRALCLAAVQLLRLGLAADAGRTARRAVELCSAAEPAEPDYLAMARIAAGVAAFEKGDPREAVRFLSMAAGEAPVTRPRAWTGPLPGQAAVPTVIPTGAAGTANAGNPLPADWALDPSSDPGRGIGLAPVPADPSSVDRLRGIARIMKGLILRDEGYDAYSNLELKRAGKNPDSMREFGLFLNERFRLARIAGQVLGKDAWHGLSPGR